MQVRQTLELSLGALRTDPLEPQFVRDRDIGYDPDAPLIYPQINR
jgi:hypothetical protein